MITERYNKKTECGKIYQKSLIPSQVCRREILGKKKGESKLTVGGRSSSKHDEAAAVSSIIPAQIDSLNNLFDDDNCEIGTTMLFAK